MDLNQVSVFVEVVKSGSFTAAARTLHMPKTTVSRRVAGLEASLGVRLLNRTTRSLSLTDAGQRYYAACRHGVTAIEAANRLAAGAQEVPTGTIRLSAPAEDFFLSDAVADFLALHKRVSVEIVLTDDRLDLIDERIDIAFRGGQLDDSSLIARKLASGSFVVCASAGYLQAAGRPETLADLKRHACIVHGKSLVNATWSLQGPGGAVQVRLNGRLAANSLMFALRAAVAGLGLVLLPDGIAAPEIAAGRLERVLPDWETARGGLYVVYPSNRHQPAAVRAFVDFIVERGLAGGRRRPA